VWREDAEGAHIHVADGGGYDDRLAVGAAGHLDLYSPRHFRRICEELGFGQTVTIEDADHGLVAGEVALSGDDRRTELHRRRDLAHSLFYQGHQVQVPAHDGGRGDTGCARPYVARSHLIPIHRDVGRRHKMLSNLRPNPLQLHLGDPLCLSLGLLLVGSQPTKPHITDQHDGLGVVPWVQPELVDGLPPRGDRRQVEREDRPVGCRWHGALAHHRVVPHRGAEVDGEAVQAFGAHVLEPDDVHLGMIERLRGAFEDHPWIGAIHGEAIGVWPDPRDIEAVGGTCGGERRLIALGQDVAGRK